MRKGRLWTGRCGSWVSERLGGQGNYGYLGLVSLFELVVVIIAGAFPGGGAKDVERHVAEPARYDNVIRVCDG